MAAEKVARGTSFGIGAETTWGTPVARTHWFQVRPGASLNRMRQKEPRNILHEGASNNIRSHVVTKEEVSLSVEILVTFEGFGLLVLHALWGAFGTSGSGPYTHVGKFGNTPPTGGLTCELIRGMDVAAGQAYSDVLEGGRIAKIVFSIETGGLMVAKLEIIGQTSSRGNTGTASYTASRDAVIAHYRGGTLDWNSASYAIKSMSITIDNGLERVYQIGSLLTIDPVMTKNRSVMLEFSRIYRLNEFETGLHADTQADAAITFTEGADTLTFEVHNAEILTVNAPLASVGVIIETVTMRGLSDGTDEGIEITFVNDQAVATTA